MVRFIAADVPCPWTKGKIMPIEKGNDHVFNRSMHKDYPIADLAESVYVWDIEGKRSSLVMRPYEAMSFSGPLAFRADRVSVPPVGEIISLHA